MKIGKRMRQALKALEKAPLRKEDSPPRKVLDRLAEHGLVETYPNWQGWNFSYLNLHLSIKGRAVLEELRK